jgi:DNA polymerase III subunit beta
LHPRNLSQGLNIVSHIASKNTSLPILNNVLIKAEKGILSLITTNLEVGIKCQIRGKIDSEGSYTVNSKLISDFINLLNKQKVELELKNDTLEITTDDQVTKIKGNSAEEFPLIPQIERKNGYQCQISDLIKSFSQVLFAVSNSETRPEISGVYMNFSESNLTLAATDSYRLAEKQIKLKEAVKADKEVIIPSKTAQELLRILGSASQAVLEDSQENANWVDIYFEDNQVLFAFDNIELVSRIIEGQYPNYKQIIPANFKTKAVLNISEFVKAVKTASLFSRTGIFDINLEFKEGKLIVSSTNNQLGENKTKLDGQITGDDNKVVINFRYLLDGLQNIDSTDVIYEMIDPANPCILRPAESLEGKEAIPGQDYLYIIMPIKQ